jgi:ABC-type nitrate/sulfonate/bicarbonate transport system permease component
MTNSRIMRVLQASAGMLVLAGVWQILSMTLPPFLFPPVPEILSRTIDILITGSLLMDVLLTAARIFGGLLGAFILGSLLAFVIARSKAVENVLTPVLTFFQGIPALSWVVFAIIWFQGTEFRVLFIMVMTTLPAFTFQILDAIRSMSKDLFEMTMAFRPSRWTLFRFLTLPTIVPGILESEFGQRRARGRGGGVGRRHRRRRLRIAAPAAIVRHGRRHGLDSAARFIRPHRAADHQRHRDLGTALSRGVRAGDVTPWRQSRLSASAT